VYGTRRDSNAAYAFPDAEAHQYDGTWYVDVYIPICFMVELNDGTVFDKQNPLNWDAAGNCMAFLKSDVIKGGSVSYNLAQGITPPFQAMAAGLR
jgi:hypothetical protein